MKIGVAQTRPVKGDIAVNIGHHIKLVQLAIDGGAEVIIFPELSLTGHEPSLANELATHKEHNSLDELQTVSDSNNITIGAGMPIRTEGGVLIGMIIFRTGQPREVYYKQYLHADELPFFISGSGQVFINDDKTKAGLAICYELSIPAHSAGVSAAGADIYIASVAKTADGVKKANETLSAIARKYSMTVLMANCVGPCDNFESAGQTSVWNNKSVLMGRLNDKDEGVLIFDTDTKRLISKLH